MHGVVARTRAATGRMLTLRMTHYVRDCRFVRNLARARERDARQLQRN